MDELADWCQRWLGARVEERLFEAGYLSRVVGVRLADGRQVVVKVRPAASRLTACTQVQRALWEAGFPCPEPLTGPHRLGGYAANAESLVTAAKIEGGAPAYAELLCRLIGAAPSPSAVGSLAPNPPWTSWDHGRDGVWPLPDDRDADLDDRPSWLDDIGRRVRERLRRAGGEPVIGHGDWEARNIGTVVHDWDSVIAAPEPVIVGLAASVWVCGLENRAAAVDESRAFLDAYQRAAGRRWSTDEIEASWAAGLWVYAFNAKKLELDGIPWLREDEAAERLRLAGA